MGVPNSEVGYTSAMPRREDHEVCKGRVGHWIKKTLELNAAVQHYEDPVENGFLSNKELIFGFQVSPTRTYHPF